MRKLQAKDIAPFGEILARTDLKPVIKEVFFSSKEREKGESIMVDFVYQMLGSSEMLMNAIFEFVAYIEEKPVEEVATIPLKEFGNLVKELFGDENFGSFFG